jgi:hypothetical protein
LRQLRTEGWEVFGFFYNPNIHPYQEFERRRETLRHLADLEQFQVIWRLDYELEEFLRQAAFREQQRCLYCYASRLEATARTARKSGFPAFSSTLLYSKRQKHDLIRSIGEEAARRHGVAFHYEDFRAGWQWGQERARALELYRQQYCGCIYSEKERFHRKPGRD